MYNRTVTWGIVLLIVAMVLVWFMWQLCSKPIREGFNPYRCGRTGMNYLDVYEQEDYYRENPYGYPNPESYTTAWYQLRRLYDKDRYPRYITNPNIKDVNDLLSMLWT